MKCVYQEGMSILDCFSALRFSFRTALGQLRFSFRFTIWVYKGSCPQHFTPNTACQGGDTEIIGRGDSVVVHGTKSETKQVQAFRMVRAGIFRERLQCSDYGGGLRFSCFITVVHGRVVLLA